MERRGQGHIEMVFSFILFLSVVFFVILFFNPSKSLDLVGGSSHFVFSQVSDALETEVLRYGLRVIQPEPVVGLRLAYVPQDAQTRAITETGQIVQSGISGDFISIANPGVSFVAVEVSDAFQPGGLVGGGAEGAVLISSSLTERVLSEKKLMALNQSYTETYDELKQTLAISPGLNFRFLVLFPDGSRVEGRQEVPTSVEVFVEEQRKELIRLDGQRVFVSLVVGVW